MKSDHKKDILNAAQLLVLLLGALFISLLEGCNRNTENKGEERDALMSYRSISFHKEPDSSLIKLAAEIGFNDICYQVEGNTLEKLQEIRRTEDSKGYMEIAHKRGMTISIWMREISNYDPDWGPVSMDNDIFWNRTAEKYDRIFTELVPEVDHIIFTVVESQVNIADSPAILERMVKLVNDKCREYGKQLVLRTFVHLPHELDSLERKVSTLPDDIIIMSKYVESDWNLLGPDHRMIGRTGEKKQFVELDITGEYFRVTYVPNCFTANLERRFEYWREQGVDGISVRVSRDPRPGAWWEPLQFAHNVYAEPNEVNLWALGYMALGKADPVEQAWIDFTHTYFNDSIADRVISILEPQGAILAEALNTGAQPFGCGRLLIPGEWTMNGQHCACADTIAVKYDDDDDMLYRNPFYHKYSPHVWHPELAEQYHRIRKGDPEVIRQKEQSTRQMLQLADSLLGEFGKLKGKMDDKTYRYYLFKLEENRWHLEVMKHWQLAWLKASNLLYFDSDKSIGRKEILHHLEELSRLSEQQDNRLTMQWYGKDVDIGKGEYLDIQGYTRMFRKYWAEVLS